ncbi:MAG: CopG family antitoxin [bacterium]
MKKSRRKRSIPADFKGLKAASDFWDNHSVADHWDETKECEFDLEIKKEPRYVALERGLSKQVTKISKQRGISPETLVNLWVKDKISAK